MEIVYHIIPNFSKVRNYFKLGAAMCTDFAVESTNKETGKSEVHVGRTLDMWYPFEHVF